MTDQQTKIPTWFWIVAVILLLWNLSGVVNFFMQLTMSEEALQDMSEVDQEFIGKFPAWVYVAFGVAVFAGVAGSLALLFKKKVAKQLFIVSLIAIIAQFGFNLSLAISMDVYVMRTAIMLVVLVGISIFSIWLSISGERRGWLF